MERDIIAELREEIQPTQERVQKLVAFLKQGKPDHISIEMWMLLAAQLDAMNDYAEIVEERIQLIEEERKENKALKELLEGGAE